MIRRSFGALLVAYLLLVVAGGFFLITPSLTLAKATKYNDLTVVWGLFYVVGGIVCCLSLVLRRFINFFKNMLSLWYFEIAGISLLITANIVYAYALVRSGLFYHEPNILALGLILSAFSVGLFVRVQETKSHIRAVVRAVNTAPDGTSS